MAQPMALMKPAHPAVPRTHVTHRPYEPNGSHWTFQTHVHLLVPEAIFWSPYGLIQRTCSTSAEPFLLAGRGSRWGLQLLASMPRFYRFYKPRASNPAFSHHLGGSLPSFSHLFKADFTTERMAVFT